MRLLSATLLVALLGQHNALGAPATQPRAPATNSTSPDADAAILDALIPAFGVVTGAERDVLQIGSCSGFNGQTRVPIPCTCPPARDVFLKTLRDALIEGSILDEPISFDLDLSDGSADTNRTRATASIIVLQNFSGVKGVGCPAASAPNLKFMQVTGARSDVLFVG
ncbi:hypothetical protein VTK73DRAFT_8003 [Phialemonium thermophilum]|uniref:Uncharacterized protein n=1 Tax=Phialemonium thermophilum TaxID=223376 RepID=A0ABR3XQ62_9PEZI